MSFSATEAAFEGFRVVRRKPLAVVFWALAYMAMMGTGFALAGGSIAGLVAAMESLEKSGTATPEEMAAVWNGYMPLIALVMAGSLVFGAVLYAAVVRSVIRPEESAFGYMRIGMDEVRVLVVSLALTVLYLVFMIVVGIVMGILVALTTQTGIPALWILVVLAALGAVVLLVWLAARFSLAVPITVAERRIAIFDSFAMTRNHAWPIVGMAIIAAVMSIVVGLLGGLVTLPAKMILFANGDIGSMAGQGTLQILQAAWPMILGWIVIQAVLSALQLAVVYAPYTAAYRDLKAG